MVKITTKIISGHNNPRRKLLGKKGHVYHWTANRDKDADALANVNFFQNTKSYASCQRVVDDIHVVSAINMNNLAYHVGARSYTTIGRKFVRNGYTPNYFLTGTELCVNMDSDFAKMEQNAIEDGAMLMIQNNYTIDDIYRHMDITGKGCPNMYLDDRDWDEFRNKLESFYKMLKVNPSAVMPPQPLVYKLVVKAKEAVLRKGPHISYMASGSKLKAGDIIMAYEWTDNFYRTDKGWISAETVEQSDILEDPELDMSSDVDEIYGMIVNANILNIREQPTTASKIIGKYSKGNIIKLLKNKGVWYQTSSGWIHGNYIDVLETRAIITLVIPTIVYADSNCTKVINKLPEGTRTIVFNKTNIENPKSVKIKEGYIKL